MKILKLVFCFFFFIFSQVAQADSFNFPAPKAYVNDYAHLLTPEQMANLNDELKAFDQQTSNQIVVATFNSLKGDSLEDFSIHLAQAWKIGSKQHDNGVLLLIIKDSHDIRIEVGYGLEGVLTDAISDVIIRNDIVPSFKQGDFAQGIQNGVHSIMQVTQGEYKGTGAPASSDNNNALLIFIIFIIALHFIGAAVRYNKIRGTDQDRGWWTFILFLLLSNGSNSSGRNGSDDDEGGFSGGGGGFGGGGASGKW